ncbi:hypothetical protein [Streptomyces griseocarneus]|uniref:hypothetical protein n=1 Tax=Streptomyces griseocarneus TaxID=51201 RepID=UPI00167C849C|nr:hypothetical protein [Streptomyces griseocarneus]MBZ6475688.1 hypothetical protein [Streptomyces griseocarneus]GHG68865.1 hypothetical protein GCM10018779_41700 [Streptomyces griseocarneus]
MDLFVKDVVSVRGIYYLPEAGPGAAHEEAVELLFEGGGSVVFTPATDWTLRVEGGRWPGLPDWCFPERDWASIGLRAAEGHLPLGRCRRIVELTDEFGEVNGAELWFGRSRLSVRSGASLRVEVTALSS